MKFTNPWHTDNDKDTHKYKDKDNDKDKMLEVLLCANKRTSAILILYLMPHLEIISPTFFRTMTMKKTHTKTKTKTKTMIKDKILEVLLCANKRTSAILILDLMPHLEIILIICFCQTMTMTKTQTKTNTKTKTLTKTKDLRFFSAPTREPVPSLFST